MIGLNRHCLCKTIDRAELDRILEGQSIDSSLFSESVFYISQADLDEMETLITSLEKVISLERYQEQVLERSRVIARKDHGPRGVFMGYDLHLTEDGPKLIEINTNAGGCYLNLILAKAQAACCEGTRPAVDLSKVEEKFIKMFTQEWTLQGRVGELENIAIMDHDPRAQYLYPEFVLFQKLFQKYQINCFIVAPEELSIQDDGAWVGKTKIDLIYNRCTDFYFETKSLAGLREVYEKDLVVITPNPYHHALFANKLNLITFSHADNLKSIVDDDQLIQSILKSVPFTVEVDPSNADWLWQNKKEYFFKPTEGHGSKATYRGDKLTRRVWEEILSGHYVAQKIVKPGVRIVEVNGEQKDLKCDVRVYTYNGETILMSARLYHGQTTNFRTPGGGFAPVFLVSR